MTPTAAELAVIWHDVECGSYEADLPVWRELASDRPGPVLDIGSGTGRVALDLAGRGHQVTALDSDPALLAALAYRATARDLEVATQEADARSFSLRGRFATAVVPMQVAQLLGGRRGRSSMLAAVRKHLEPGGVLAVALADPFEHVQVEAALPPLPDVREEEGWVFSTTPVALRSEPDAVAIEHLRQSVSPEGELTEQAVTIRLDHVRAHELEVEGAEAGYRVHPARRVPETTDYVGSTVVVLEAA